MDLQRTVVSAAAGGVVSVVAGFLPFVSLVGPLLGGGVAGYPQGTGPRDGAGVGALVGGFLAVLGAVLRVAGPVLPPIPAAVVLGPWARAFGLGSLGGTATVVVSAVLLVVVGAVGGWLGGALGGQPHRLTNGTPG